MRVQKNDFACVPDDEISLCSVEEKQDFYCSRAFAIIDSCNCFTVRLWHFIVAWHFYKICSYYRVIIQVTFYFQQHGKIKRRPFIISVAGRITMIENLYGICLAQRNCISYLPFSSQEKTRCMLTLVMFSVLYLLVILKFSFNILLIGSSRHDKVRV